MARRHSYNRRRRRSRGRLGLLLKLLCIGAVLLALTAGATVFFRVEQVAVSGNVRYTEEEIVAASGIQTGDNLYALNKNSISQKLRTQLPYIGELTIRRALPNTIEIGVTEWEAVAQIQPPTPLQAQAARQELEEQGQKALPAGSGAEEGSAGEELPIVAQEPWLINVEGKLLEPAPADSTAIRVTGVTAVLPRAGTPLATPQAERARLEVLLALLDAMDKAGMTGDFNAIDLGDTQIVMRYLDRFDVKLHVNDDLAYALQVIAKCREDIENKHGPDASGSMDLTQEGYELIYSPG